MPAPVVFVWGYFFVWELFCGEGKDDGAVVCVAGTQRGIGESGPVGSVRIVLAFDGDGIVVAVMMASLAERSAREPVARIDLHTGRIGVYVEYAA